MIINGTLQKLLTQVTKQIQNYRVATVRVKKVNVCNYGYILALYLESVKRL